MKKSGQHVVPQSYLREFVDPFTSPGHKPYVWFFEKGSRKGKPKSPKNILKSTDIYTLDLGNSKKSYAIEESLSKLESRYAVLFRKKVKNYLPLSDDEHTELCAFAYAMYHRTEKFKANLESSLDRMLNHIGDLEKLHLEGRPSKTGEEFRQFRKNAHRYTLMDLLPEMLPIVKGMDVAFFCAPAIGSRFITTDNPCYLWNPELQWQRIHGPGLGQSGVELIMPLSPTIALCLNHKEAKGYIQITNRQVDDLNRMARRHADKYFISNTSKSDLLWFSPLPLDPIFLLLFLRKRVPVLLRKGWLRIFR